MAKIVSNGVRIEATLFHLFLPGNVELILVIFALTLRTVGVVTWTTTVPCNANDNWLLSDGIVSS